jgi:hypothetical protein
MLTGDHSASLPTSHPANQPDMLAGLLAGWLVGWLAGWPAGWLATHTHTCEPMIALKTVIWGKAAANVFCEPALGMVTFQCGVGGLGRQVDCPPRLVRRSLAATFKPRLLGPPPSVLQMECTKLVIFFIWFHAFHFQNEGGTALEAKSTLVQK